MANKTTWSKTFAARLLSTATIIGVGATALESSEALALPTGGNVVSGSATGCNIGAAAACSGTIQNITVSDKTIINWSGGFNTLTGETVQFNQSNASTVLNRVTNGAPTTFLGNLRSNGNVWVINPNGMLFGPGSSVKVGSLLLSTADIDNDKFLHPATTGGTDTYKFDKASPNQVNAVITLNDTHIDTSQKKGDVVIMAPGVVVKGSNIETGKGGVFLASGQTFTVDFNGDGLVNYGLNSIDTKVSVKVKDANGNNLNSNVYVGDNTTINGGGNGTGKGVKIAVKVDKDAILDHIVNLGGEFQNDEVDPFKTNGESKTFTDHNESDHNDHNVEIHPFAGTEVDIVNPPVPTNPTPAPTSAPTPEPTEPPQEQPTPTTAPAPVVTPTRDYTNILQPTIDPLTRPVMSVADETVKDNTTSPKVANVTYERPYLVHLSKSIADGKLTLDSRHSECHVLSHVYSADHICVNLDTLDEKSETTATKPVHKNKTMHKVNKHEALSNYVPKE